MYTACLGDAIGRMPFEIYFAVLTCPLFNFAIVLNLNYKERHIAKRNNNESSTNAKGQNYDDVLFLRRKSAFEA
jgi:hypothetical protein